MVLVRHGGRNPPETVSAAEDFVRALDRTGFMNPLIMITMVIGGLAMLFHRTAPLGLVVFEETWNRHDMEAYGQLFHEDADFVNRFGGHYAGRDEIILRHREIHDTIYSDSTLAVDAPEVTTISNDAVILRFYMRLTAGAAHPAGPHQADALMLAVATRKDGVWRVQVAQNTTLIGRDGQPMLRMLP